MTKNRESYLFQFKKMRRRDSSMDRDAERVRDVDKEGR